MIMDLHPAIGKNRYCGPGALSILTGHPTDHTARVLRAWSGKRAICGITSIYMLHALRALGQSPQVVEALQRLTLQRWAERAPAGRYLVETTDHYVVVRVTDGIEVCDNMSVYPLPLSRFKRRRLRVKQAWRVSAVL